MSLAYFNAKKKVFWFAPLSCDTCPMPGVSSIGAEGAALVAVSWNDFGGWGRSFCVWFSCRWVEAWASVSLLLLWWTGLLAMLQLFAGGGRDAPQASLVQCSCI